MLVGQLNSIVTALYANGDNAATLLLASDAPAGSITKIGDHPFFEAWWFMRLTAHLPDHIVIWQGAPFLIAFIGIGGLAACAAQLTGRTGAVLAGSALLAMSGPLRAVLLVPEARVGLLLHAAVLCGALIVISRWQHTGRMSPRRWAVAAVAVVAFTSPALTDALLLPAAVLPFVAAAWLCWVRERTPGSRALLTFALGTSASAYGLAHALTRLMTASGVVVNRFPVHLVSIRDVGRSVGVTLHLYGILAGGEPAAGGLALCGLGAAGVMLWRDRNVLGQQPVSSAERVRVLYFGFWGCALVLSLGAVAGSSVAINHGVYDAAERYLLGAWCATVALLAGSARTRLRVNLMAVAVCGFGAMVLASDLHSVRRPWEYGPPPTTSTAIARFTSAQEASVGYGGYWDVMSIGLAERSKVRMVPIVALGTTGRWAGHFVAANSSWFTGHSVRRSFLVVDARRSVPFAPHQPPRVFGRPFAQRRFGSLTVYVYGHDLAGDLTGTST